MFHKEGRIIILVTFLVVIGCSLLADTFIPVGWLRTFVLLVLLLFLTLILQFFRNPKRKTIVNDGHVVSPVDGKVVVIEEVFEKEFFNEKRLQVSVFMSPINVHVTRYPISGTVIFSKYHPRKIFSCMASKSK